MYKKCSLCALILFHESTSLPRLHIPTTTKLHRHQQLHKVTHTQQKAPRFNKATFKQGFSALLERGEGGGREGGSEERVRKEEKERVRMGEKERVRKENE